MRNLKWALSLALSTVMLMGMMVVGTGAAGYPDVTSKDNEEAIEVMQAVGVMTGDADGNFNPDQNVTRAEMAVVMANLLDLRVSDFVGASIPFTDVPEWAHAYVAACYADGITAGTSATTYGSDESVTSVQAALMMMKALGYFQYQKDFGGDWQVATIKQASQIKLFDGIDSSRTAAMTRNEVAQIALNTLKATMVEAEGDTTDITLPGDIIISAGNTKYVKMTDSGSEYSAINSDEKVDGTTTIQLGEYLFDGDLKLDKGGASDVDSFGAPANVWSYKDFEGKYAQEADYTVVVDEKNKNAEYWAEEADKDLVIAGATVRVNGGSFDSYQVGDVISYYVDEDDADKVTHIVITRYTADVITEVDTDVKDDDAEDGVSAYITFEDAGTFNDTDIAGFNPDTYEEDAVVALIEGSGDYADEIIASFIPETVEGAISAYSTANKTYTLDGTKYTMVGQIGANDEIGGKVDFDEGNYRLYLDENGYVLKTEVMEGNATIDDVFYLQDIDSGNVYWTDEETTKGQKTTTYYVQAVNLDGTVTELEVATVKNSESEKKTAIETYLNALDAGFYTDEDYEVSYNDGSDKTYDVTLTSWSDDDYETKDVTSSVTEIKDDTKRVGGYYLNSDTQYVVVEKYTDTDDFAVSVKTGSISYTKSGSDKIFVIASDSNGSKVAEYVIVSSDSYTAASSGDYIYVADDEYNTVSGGKEYTVYDKNGDEIQIVVDEDDSTVDSLTEGNYYEYAILNNGNYDIKGEYDDNVEEATYSGSYNDLLSVSGNAEDIDTSDAIIVDAHDRDADNQYSKAVETLSAMQKAKDAGYIVKLHIVYTDSDKDAAEMIVVESVISKSAAAGDAIDSTGDYDFVGSIIIEDNNVTASGSNSYVNATDGVTKDYIADLARFLGALYRTSGAEEIKFDGKTYNWNTDGTLQGSNWTENGVNDNSKSLVKAIDTKLGVLEAGDSVEITLTVDGNAMTYSIAIAE